MQLKEVVSFRVETVQSNDTLQRTVAMQDESAQQSFVEETQAQAIAGEEISSLPDLGFGRVLIMVEAEERAADGLSILNRNHAVTGGVRIPPA